ncbi:MAG TPA: hypothetical protein VK869_15190 [Rubrobacteraceae bacterium]|nr:hypothetical protein [Rubrobacteraceae bacterium]
MFQDAKGAQLLVREELDVVAAHGAPKLPTHEFGDLVDRSPPVGVRGNEIQQPGELDDLSVWPPHEVGRLLEPRILVFAE